LPLAAAIGVVYLGLLAVFAVLMTVIITPVVQQTTQLIRSAPELLDQVQIQIANVQRQFRLPAVTPNLEEYVTQIAQQAPALAAGVLNVTLGVVTSVAGVLVVLVMAFYWLLERRDIEGTWISLVPRARRAETREVIEEIEAKLGAYVRGQLILAVIVGLISFFGLLVLEMPYILVLALVAGIGELIPLAGPIIGAVPAVVIAFATQSPQEALLVLALYIAIQQFENNFLVPKVMQRSVGLSPLTVLLAVLAGAALLGIIGALLAVPIASAIQVILQHTLFRKQQYLANASPTTTTRTAVTARTSG
jgi:predicted PurR-regulated permease PerM